jgi:hypothetical protein
VRKVCERAIVLDHGELVSDSPPGEAIRTFRETLQYSGLGDPAEPEEVAVAEPAAEVAATEAAPAEPISIGRERVASATHKVKITNVTIDHPGLLAGRRWLLPDEPMSIQISYHADEPTDDLLFGIAIHDEDGNDIYGTNTKRMEIPVPVADGDGQVSFDFEHVPLLDGTFLVSLAIQSSDEGTVHDWRDQEFQFEVMNPTRTVGLVSLPLEVRFGPPYAGNVEAIGS